jgi:hypothetical protein
MERKMCLLEKDGKKVSLDVILGDSVLFVKHQIEEMECFFFFFKKK